MARRPIDLVKAVAHEIAREKAFSLGRTGARLERGAMGVKRHGLPAEMYPIAPKRK